MTLPEWAESAFQTCRPQPQRYANNGEPDPVALDRWEAFTARYRARWGELGADQWKIEPGKGRARISYYIVLAALECSRRMSVGARPSKVLQARREAARLDEQISEAAAHLAGLFRQRDELGKEFGVTRWGPDVLDAIDLWDALELTFAKPISGDGGNMNTEVWDRLQSTLASARGTSLRVPQWVDMLEHLGERFEHCNEVLDASTTAGNTNKSEFSPWCNALIGTLHAWGVLDHLSLAQLAGLASVAFDARDDEINPRQIGELRAAELKRD